jgi:hypothetical protein
MSPAEACPLFAWQVVPHCSAQMVAPALPSAVMQPTHPTTTTQESGMALDDRYPYSMTARPATQPPAAPAIAADMAFMNTLEAGNFLRLSPRTLEKLRVHGGGPQFRKLGARVVYTVADLRAWADTRILGMTSDPGNPQRTSVR